MAKNGYYSIQSVIARLLKEDQMASAMAASSETMTLGDTQSCRAIGNRTFHQQFVCSGDGYFIIPCHQI